ncbi:MAG: hypothetical protein HY666_02860 [Chloroflexi bacterium]|nr:hypothetical protein [Chloroflexota bacterium]
MEAQLRGYLYGLSRQLHLEPVREREVLRELQGHVEDRAQELIEKGMPPKDALHQALKHFGQPKSIARGLYEVHSRGSWLDISLAITPHLLFALLFAFNLWSEVLWVSVLLVATALVSFLGWMKDRPNWSYPWLGYCLIAPGISWVFALSALAYGAWSLVTKGSLPMGIPVYIAALVYIPVAMWLGLWIFSKVVRRDWLLASLTTLPFPFLTYWLLYFQSRRPLVESANPQFTETGGAIALVFLSLALVTALFLRIGQRVIKAVLLLVATPALAMLIWLSYEGNSGYMGMLFFSMVSVILLLSPALLEHRLGGTEESLLPQ